MNRYRRLLYVVLCLLLSNIYDYVESPETFEIDDDFPNPVGPEVVAEYLKNKEFEIPLPEALENVIYPDDLVPEDAVEENEPEKVEADIKIDFQNCVIPKEIIENGLATEEELTYIYEKARMATFYLLLDNRNKRSKNSVVLPNIGPDERLPILLDLAWLDHWYLDCEFDGILRVYSVKKNFVIFGVIIHFNYISSSSKIIWQSKSYYEFANKVIANGGFEPIDTDKVSVFLENGEIKHYVKTKSGWIERSRCIEIDINFRQCTYDYVHYKKDETDVFIPRYDFKISKLVFVPGPFYKSHVDMWEAKDKYHYAKKVECVSHTKNIISYVIIMIHMLNGDLLKLVRKNNKWLPTDPKKVLPVQLSLWSQSDSISYRIYKNATFRIFEAKEGFSFNILKISTGYSPIEKVLWETHDPKECAYKVMIDGIDIVMDTKNIIIYHISDKFTHLKLIDYKWMVIEPSMILDINHKESNIGYKYFKDNGEIEYFIPMGGCLFKEVISEGFISMGRVEIWKAKSKMEYACKAIVIKMGKNAKYLVLLLYNKDILLFHRLDKGHPWIQRSIDNSTLYELRMMAVDLSDPRDLKQNKYRIIGNSVEIMPSEPSVVAETQPVVPVSKPMPVMRPDNFVDLDITKVYGIRGYDIFYRDDKLIFEAREHYLFKSVTKNEEILWKPKNNIDFPNKVLYKRVDNTDKIKVYFPDKIKEDPPKPKPKLSFDPSTIQVEVTKCKKPGSELYKATAVEVSGTPVTTTLDDPDDLYVAPKQARKKQWVIDDD